MSASEDAPDDGPTEAEIQALVDGMAEFANETGDMVRDVLRERETTQAAFAHLSDVAVSRAEMDQIAAADAAWEHVSVRGGVGWHNTDTDEVVFAGTPSGVPDNYVYVPPDEEVGDEYDVVESPQGATYRSPQPTDGSGDINQSISDLANGNPRARIETAEGATEYLSEFDEDNFDFDHWSGGGNFNKVSEGSVVKVWTGDFGFENERALVIDANGDEYTVVTEDGVEKTMSADITTSNFDHTTEAPLADVWNDAANRANESTQPEVETEDVQDDPTWFEERDFESEYGAPESVTVTEGMPIELGGEIRRVEDTTTENGVEYHELDNGQVMATVDGVLTKTNDSSTVDTGTEQYITWSDDADLDDGWYAVDDDIIETDTGELIVEFTDADGETHEVNGVDVERDGLIERKHTPVDAEIVDPAMEDAHESYDESYPTDPSLKDNVSIDGISDNLDTEQREQITRGLGKAQDLGLTDNVTAVTEMDVEGEASGMTLGRYEPESGEIKINTERMNQETLDSVDDAFAVGENVEDMIVHETIHAEHAQALKESGMSPEEMREQFLRSDLPDSEQELMEDAVSEYGAANPLEVVAEIGTKITLGEEVSTEALHLYEKYGGPEL